MPISTIKLHRASRRNKSAYDKLYETTLGGSGYPNWNIGLKNPTKVEHKDNKALSQQFKLMKAKGSMNYNMRMRAYRLSQQEKSESRSRHIKNLITLLEYRNENYN